MAEATRLVRDNAYEEMGASYQCVQIAALDAALREHGISDTAVRQKVCESFIFNMGVFHDQGWLKASPKGQALFPLLCFSTRFLDCGTPIEGLGTVYAPSEMFAYHEYALGSVSVFYEGDPAAQVETGSFEGEDSA